MKLAFVFAAFGIAFIAHASDVLAAMTGEELAGAAFDAFTIGDWWGLGAIGVFALTLAIRSGAASKWAGTKFPRLSKWLLNPMVMFFVPIFLAGIPGTLAAVFSGQPFTLGLLLKSIVAVSGGAKTIFLGWKNFVELRESKNQPKESTP